VLTSERAAPAGGQWRLPEVIADIERDRASLSLERARGVDVRRLPSLGVGLQLVLPSLTATLRALAPDVVQVQSLTHVLCVQAAHSARRVGSILFAGYHTPAATFPGGLLGDGRPALRFKVYVSRAIPAQFVMKSAPCCYCVTQEAFAIARDRLGINPAQLRLLPLGADTETYTPVSTPADALARATRRAEWGCAADDCVIITSGRLTAEKNPLFLAKTVRRLRDAGCKLLLVCFGAGPQADALRRVEGTLVFDPIPQAALADRYRAADIAAWPFSMTSSQADAMASGLPTIVSDSITKPELAECGAVPYRTGDADSLADVIRCLLDPSVRTRVGANAAARVRESLSWDAIAAVRLADYRAAIRGEVHG